MTNPKFEVSEFDQVTEDGRASKQITLPGGTFRMYEDTPFVWNQILTYEGEKLIVEVINDAFINGHISKK